MRIASMGNGLCVLLLLLFGCSTNKVVPTVDGASNAQRSGAPPHQRVGVSRRSPLPAFDQSSLSKHMRLDRVQSVHAFALNPGNSLDVTDFLRGDVAAILWGDVSGGNGGSEQWTTSGGNMPPAWNPTFTPATTVTCPQLCYSTKQTITTAVTDKPGFYLDQISSVPSDGPYAGDTLGGAMNWNELQVDVTSVNQTNHTVAYTLGGGSGTAGLFQISFNGKIGGATGSAYYPSPNGGVQLGVGSGTYPLHCLAVKFGTFTSANGIWATADTWSTRDYFGPNVTISPSLVIPSTALLSAISKAAVTADQAGALKYLPIILQGINNYGITDTNQIAAILAQVEIETDFNYPDEAIADPEGSYGVAKHPVPAGQTYNYYGNSKVGDGATYIGRGWAQLTGRNNYTRFGAALNLDLVDTPSLAADPTNAAEILAYGMATGAFAQGKTLGDYVNSSAQDYTDVRAILNSGDTAAKYADSGTYGKAFAAVTGGC
jgi:predicted chitinase